MYALIDCNNFFVSCERALNPALEKVPVVVLSSNDGCVISRSQEAKKLGISMGLPYYQGKDIFTKEKVRVFSGNFSLYGNFSDRVMTTLEHFANDVEVYSIDEAFIDLTSVPDPINFARELRATIRRWTRIPVSIGIAPTKVLAKAANHYAKDHPEVHGVYMVTKPEAPEFLKQIGVGAVWGIGRESALKLIESRINTAFDLTQAPDTWIKKLLSIGGVRIAQELRGDRAHHLETDHDPKKGITCSRSFGEPITTFNALKEAVATHVAHATEKLRAEKQAATHITVFVRTSHFSKGKKYSQSLGESLPIATSFTPDLITAAEKLLSKIYKDGYRYAKAGVHLYGLVPENTIQQNLFLQKKDSAKNERLMRSLDRLNQSFGTDTVRFLGTGLTRPWSAKRQFRSPEYTTKFSELPIAR